MTDSVRARASAGARGRRRAIAWLAALGAGVALPAGAQPSAALQGRVLVVGSEQDYPPFAIGMTDATADGFTVGLWEAVARRQDLAYEIRVRPFNELLRDFRSGAVDVLINLAQSDERRRYADFSVTHVIVHGAIFVRDGDARIRSEADLAGKAVIVLKGDLAQDYAAGQGWQGPLVPVDTVEEGLRLLAAGAHDAMLLSRLAGLQTIRNQGIAGVHPIDAAAGFSQRFAFAVRKGDTELLARINEGLALTKADGTYDRLYEKWFGVYEPRERGWSELRPVLGGAFGLLALAWAALYARRRRRDRIAAAHLRDSEERWKYALEGAGDGVWDADLEAGVSLYSRRWKQIIGYQDDEIGHDPAEWRQRIHPDDRERVLAENQACIDGRTDSFVSEFRMRTKDGGWIWVLDRGRVVRRNSAGRACRMIGTHTDISERKATQAREAANAQAMTLLATGAPLAAVLEAIVRGIEASSDWLCSILLADAAGTQLRIGAAPSLPDEYNRAIDGLAIAPDESVCGAAAHSRVRQVSADLRNERRWTKYLGVTERAGIRACWSEPIVGADGSVLGTFAAYRREPGEPGPADAALVAEATRMATIAIERRRDEQALRASEERLQRALDASRLALWDFDLDSGEVFLSDAWSEMLGGPRVPTRTTFDALGALVPDEDQPKIALAMAEALDGRAAAYAVEHRVRRLDGKILWIRSQGRVVERGADGRVLRAVGTNRDISERQRAQATQALLEQRLREAQKLEAIGTLAGGIAHDFNNIMAAILGNVALARQDVESAHPARAYLEQINKAGQRARSLVQQILAFSRKQPGEFAAHSLRPVIEETVSMLRSIAGPGTQLRTVLPEHPLRVTGNSTQLQQVLMNLGSNALQALPRGAGTIEIGLEVQTFRPGDADLPAGLEAGTYAHVWVRDDGCGMDEETREHIFEPFYTTKPVGQGTGLGLAVVHGIVESHGGAVAVATAPGAGSTFHVYLPPVDEESAPMPLQPSAATAPPGQGEHVLYIDDDEVMALMVDSLLQRLGYRATCLLDAYAAIGAVERDPAAFDVVVTDFNMPTLSGVDVARRLARIRPDLPVVISTGYLTDEVRAAAADLGVRAVMRKEHTFEELGAVVHAALHAAVGSDRRDA